MERTDLGEDVGFDAAWIQATANTIDRPNPTDQTRDDQTPDDQNSNEQTPGRPEIERPVSYTLDIAPLLSASCISCHAPGRSRSNSDLSTYESTLTYKEFVVSKVLDGSMPTAGALPNDQKELFFKWEAGGYAK